jgi:hypothetical protein
MNGEEKADWSYEEDGGKLVVSLVEDVSEVAVKTRL